MKSTHVLFYGVSSMSGGAIAYLRNMLPALGKIFNESRGERLTILAHESQRGVIPISQHLSYRWIAGSRPSGYRRLLWERRHVASIVAEESADVLFTPYQIGPRVQDVKRVLMLRNMEPFFFQRYAYGPSNWLRNGALRWRSCADLKAADRAIAVSSFAKSFLLEKIGVAEECVRTIHHGRDPFFSPGNSHPEDKDALAALGLKGDFVLACGSMLPYRRYEDVLSAFERLEGSGAPLQFVIAGTGTDARYARRLRRLIDKSPAFARVILAGHVSREAMAALYRASAVCVISSEIEACPNIAIEAMASGCVIVYSDSAPLPEMLGDCGLRYRARDVRELARQINRGLHDKALSVDLRGRAVLRAQQFSWDRCARETHAALVEW